MWRLAEDTLGQEDLEALADWLRTGPQLTQGPMVSDFEAAWADWVGTEDAVMVSSGSTANLALVSSLRERGTGPPLRIGAAAVTWPTNITPGMMLGHDTTLIDIDQHTLGVDTEQAGTLIDNDEIDVLFVTHLLGFNALTPELCSTAKAKEVPILEDCCEAHGAVFQNQRVGGVGLASTFSFYFGHHMSTIEGGMVNTNDRDLADRLRMIRNHGLARSSRHYKDFARQFPEIDDRFLFVLVGMNYRSTELNAFLGLRQLEVIDARIAQRNANLQLFMDEAPDWLWTSFRTEGVSSFAIPLIASDEIGFDAIVRVVEELGVEARPVVAGNLISQPFASKSLSVTSSGDRLPVAEHVHRFGLYVGNGHHVTLDMISELCAALRKAR